MTAHPGASWFETRGVATLLAMRVEDLILRTLRSALARVSKDEAAVPEKALVAPRRTRRLFTIALR